MPFPLRTLMDKDNFDWLTHMTEEDFDRYIAENIPLDKEVASLLFGETSSGSRTSQKSALIEHSANRAQESGDNNVTVQDGKAPVLETQRNETPCGPCKSREKKCTPISLQPQLCEFCSKRGEKRCPPRFVKIAGADTPSTKLNKDKDGFVYEYMDVD